MSARLALGSSFVFLAAVPVMAGLGHVRLSHRSLAEAFATPQPLATPIRLERTPRMDGVFRAEEWDVLWGQVPSATPPPAPAPAVVATPPPAAPVVTPPVTPAPTTQTPPATATTQTPPPPTTTTTSGAGTILTGPIGGTTTTTSDTGHAKGPSSTPIDQTPPAKPKTPPPPSGQSETRPLTPINIQPTTPQAVKPTPPPTPPPAAVVTPPAPPAPSQAAFMSWEPGKLYFGAIVNPGNDMLVTIDASNNGFLVGKDNLEIRVTPGATPTVKARILDATAAAGPAWIDAPGFEMASVVASAPRPDGSVFIELSVTDPGYGILKTSLKDTVGLRVDSVPSTTPATEANLPRAMSTVQLADQRIANLPEGVGASVATKGRSVVAGGTTNVKWQLTGTDTAAIKYVEISGEGGFGDKVNFLRVPSPGFNPRGQSVIDYPTRVLPDAATGYGVLKSELTGTGWVGGTVESSIRVAPALDILAPAKRVKFSEKAAKITCAADVLSNTDLRVEGNFQVIPPAGWRVIDGSDKDFFIYDKGAKALRQFILEVPPGAKGTFKAKIKIIALGGTTEQPYWITIL